MLGHKISSPRGQRDRAFLARVFHKLLLNFTWWVNQKDVGGKNLFAGGFLGLDNIGIFDRSQKLPNGGYLEQADGTAWMAFYCATMLSIALELSSFDPSYEDIASKFFEHFIAITEAINTHGGTGLWNEEDGFYYDQLHVGDKTVPLRIRSLVGIIPLLAVDVLEDEVIARLPGFRKRMEWFISHRQDLARHISYLEHTGRDEHGHRLLAVPSRERLEKILRYVLDEREFLSPYGIRSLSQAHREKPFRFALESQFYEIEYSPGESTTSMFGGNSNWRGPVWFPLNYLLIESLERYHHFYGDSFTVEYPTGSGERKNLLQVANDLASRLSQLFLPGADGCRPYFGSDPAKQSDPLWRNNLLFHEYFHGDTGKGLGASHQTGWTALVTRCLEKRIAARS
jgi:Glycosyl hydrolase family 63 C-terminal domain